MWKQTDKPNISVAQQVAILAFSIFYFVQWIVAPKENLNWPVQIGAYLLFIVGYFTAFNIRQLTLGCAMGMVAMAYVIAPYNYGANTFAIYACSFFAYFQPPKRALLWISLTILSLLICTWQNKLHPLFYFGISAVMIMGLSVSGIIDRQQIHHRRREQHSQQEIKRLAKIAERERIGQDLHDVIGHNLTGIHLKAQLAVENVQQGEYAEAKTQCQTIADLSQQALREIRETLADIKKQSLFEECTAQKVFLNSLDIDFDFQLPDLPIPATLESDLLLVIRELITNSLRHADASHYVLRIQAVERSWLLQYTDNGKGLADTSEQQLGSGLQGIRRRIVQHQGEFSLGTKPGFELTLRLPRN